MQVIVGGGGSRCNSIDMHFIESLFCVIFSGGVILLWPRVYDILVLLRQDCLQWWLVVGGAARRWRWSLKSEWLWI